MISSKFEPDESEAPESPELTECLKQDERAMKAFEELLKSHQNYYRRYVCNAKTPPTKAGIILNVINAMYKKQLFGEMIRSLKTS